MLTFASLCSGIEAASVAWLPLGFRPLFLAELDLFPTCLLAHRYPDTPNLGDITSPSFLARAAAFGRPDILIAGTPCQAFSVAGLRKGLADARGNLTLRFVEIANALNPKTILWENVPGVLSDNTNAFGCLLAALAGLPDPVRPPDKFKTSGFISGPLRRVAWRVLNAQHFGVPQRRRRVFIIANPGDGPCPAQILFERESLLGNPPAGAETRQELAHAVTASTGGASGKEQQLTFVSADNQPLNALSRRGTTRPELPTAENLAWREPLICGTLPTRSKGGDGGDFNFSGGLIVSTPSIPSTPSTQSNLISPAVTAKWAKGSGGPAGDECQNLVLSPVANPITTSSKFEGDASRGNCVIQDVANTLTANWQQGVGVRRLTPRECERLQGFPDDYTRINDKTADGPRYKALGNSMAVPVIRWLGRRIQSCQSR